MFTAVSISSVNEKLCECCALRTDVHYTTGNGRNKENVTVLAGSNKGLAVQNHSLKGEKAQYTQVIAACNNFFP